MKIKDFKHELTIQTFDYTGENPKLSKIFKFDEQKILAYKKTVCGIYWCINPQKRLNKRQVENTTELKIVGLDCDIAKEKDNVDEATRNKLKKELFKKLVNLPLPPSGIIETKNGLQPYWYFDPTKQIKNPSKINEQYKLLIKSFTRHTGISSESDSLCRVLRLPGTYHQKNPSDKFKIKEIYPEGKPTTLEKFIEVYPLIEKEETNQQSPVAQDLEKIASLHRWDVTRGLKESEHRYWDGRRYVGRDDLMKSLALSILNHKNKYNYEPLKVLLYLNRLMADPLSEKVVVEKLKSALKAPPPIKASTESLTDTSNAELFCELYGNKVRFDHRRRRWLIWDKHRWVTDNDDAIKRLAIQTTRERHRRALEIKDYKEKERVCKWAISSESRMRIDAAISIVKSLKPISDDGRSWDLDSSLLSCPNGIIELKTGKIRDGKPNDKITMSTAIEYDPSAECPRWTQFIDEVFENNQELINFTHKALGYSITGSMKEQVVFFCFGTGANGKSVLFTTIRNILGDYGHDAPVSLLQRSRGNSIPNDLAATDKKRFLVSSETLSTSTLNEQRIKAWTGGDKVSARFLYGEFFEFEPTAKPWLFINHKPKVEDDSFGFWRRVRLIPFNKTFMGDDADGNLPDKLMNEASGILNWLVQGAIKWQKEGLDPIPQEVSEATKVYQTENDELYDFLADVCIENEHMKIKARVFYSEYYDWATNQGFMSKDILSNAAFGRKMSNKFKKIKKREGIYYLGIGLDKKYQANVGLTLPNLNTT